MDVKRRGKRVRWFRRLILFGFFCLAGAVLGIYLARVKIVQYIATKILADIEPVEASFQWERLDPKASSLSNVTLRSDSYRISIKQIDVSYDLKTIWKKREIKGIQLQGVKLFYDLTGPSTVDLDEVDTFIKSGIPFPMESVKLSDVKIVLLTELGETEFDLNAVIEREEDSRIRVDANAKTLTESLNLGGTISDRIRLAVQAQTADLEGTLANNSIEWRNQLPLPSGSETTLSDVSLSAEVVLHGIILETSRITATIGPISYRETDKVVELDRIQVDLELSGTEVTSLDSRIALKRLSIAPLTVFESELRIQAKDLNEVMISIPETAWSTLSGERGLLASQTAVQIDSEYTLQGYSGNIAFQEFLSSAFDLVPFTLSFEGTPDSVSLACPTLADRLRPWLAIENTQAMVTELRSDESVIELSSRIISNPTQTISESASTVSGIWNLKASAYPKAVPQSARIEISPEASTPIFRMASTELNGSASLQADFEFWPDSQEGAVKIGFSGSSLEAALGEWSIQGGMASMDFATERIDLEALSETAEDRNALIEWIAPQSSIDFTFQGSELIGPSELTLQWFSGNIQSIESNPDVPIQAGLQLGTGIVRIGPETINQFSLESKLSGSLSQMSANTSASLLFENEPVTLKLEQSIDLVSPNLVSKGRYTIEGINLLSSDILSRHVDLLNGSVVSGQAALDGDFHWISDRGDATARIQISNGSFQLPSKELSIDSISSEVFFTSLSSRTTEKSQKLTAEKIQIGDIEATQFETTFNLAAGERIEVEKARLNTFDGTVAVDPFSLSLENPNANFLVRFDRISIAPAIAMLDFFDGNVTGRLKGSLPITLRDGYPVLGEGFLELDPNEPARFSYNADGFFTEEKTQPKKKIPLGDKILNRLGLEPNALLEDALGNVNIQQLRLDLFSKDLPETPMRIQLAGIADTGKAKIPLNITTNVNGTVAELLNFLTRLDSLGLVAGEPPESNNL